MNIEGRVLEEESTNYDINPYFTMTNNAKDPGVNIDAADVHDQLALVEYVEDMYQLYKLTENEIQVHDCMDS